MPPMISTPTSRLGVGRRRQAVPSRLTLGGLLGLTACGSIERGSAVPATLQDQATVLGIADACYLAVTQADLLREGVLTIAGSAISTMISSSGHNDIMRLQSLAERDGVEFSLAYIQDDFTKPWESPFDRDWMRALFYYGRARTVEERIWVDTHPTLAPRGAQSGAEARAIRANAT